jgi:hypothetical protein
MLAASQWIATPTDCSKDENTALSPSQPPYPEELPSGSLIEISGPEARAQAARILAENRHVPAAWIEQQLHPLPREITEAKLNFDRVLFLNGGKDSAWAATALLSSGHFPLLVFYAPYENEAFLRRLRRLARQFDATVLLLREDPCFSWTIRVQLHAVNGRLKVLRWRQQ